MKSPDFFKTTAINVFLVVFLLMSSSTAFSKTIELSYATVFPPTHIHAKLGKAWAEEIEKRTDGRVKINYYPGGALLKGAKLYSGILSGIADIGMSVFVYNRGMFPGMEVMDLPLGFSSGKMATSIINDFYEKFPPEKLDKEVKTLYLHAHGPGLLHSKKEVRTLEDIKGLKIRGQGATARIIKGLGGVPVAMGQAGAYEALQKGVVEANFSPMEVLDGWKQAEVTKYTTQCYSIGYSSTFYLVMNKNKWNSLPQDIKDIIQEINKEWSVKHGEAWDNADSKGREVAIAKGNTIITLSDAEKNRWKSAVQPAIDEYIDNANKKGLPGAEYVETVQKMIADYK